MLVLTALVDSGADVTVVPRELWPQTWPAQYGGTIMGVGGEEGMFQSIQPITVRIMDQEKGALTAVIRPVIAKIQEPITGRDAMHQMGLVIQNLE